MAVVTFPLRLELIAAEASTAETAAPAAWFIPGADPAIWLGELAEWNVPLEQARLFVLPAAVRNRSAAGVLVVVPATARPRTSPLSQPYQVRGGRLYFPRAARLAPDLKDAELSRELSVDVAVLHPSIGLIGWSNSEALRLSDLLTAPAPTVTAWDRAEPGETLHERLESVTPLNPPTVESLFQSGRDDIGDKSNQLAPPPPAPPPQGLAGLANKAKSSWRQWMKNLADGLAKQQGRGAPGAGREAAAAGGAAADPSGQGTTGSGAAGGEASGGGLFGGMLRALAGWAARQAVDPNPTLEEQRADKLRELLKMLETDPENGLRFALPLAGDSHRGRADGSGVLPPRDVNFDLGRTLGGGAGPGSAWYAPDDVYQGLLSRYRTLAERELRLGRCRRAAYIYAELLNDLPSAVSALKQGKHHREAAILLRDRLHNVLEAANCFAEGGLIQEAVELYQVLEHYERAGDLLLRIDRPDRAEVCYRIEAERLVKKGQLLAAARLTELKINSPDEALKILSDGWRGGIESLGCLKARFELLNRLGRHAVTTTLVEQLLGDTSLRWPASVAALLSDQSREYSDRPVRLLLADATRRIAAAAIPASNASDRDTIVSAVTRLAPEDLLLGRDGQRFLGRLRSAQGQRLPVQTSNPTSQSEFLLPQDVDWTYAASNGSTLFAAGFSQRGLTAVRTHWTDRVQRVEWPSIAAGNRSMVLAAAAAGRILTILRPLHAPAGVHAFPKGIGFPEFSAIGTPAWLPDKVIGCANGDDGSVTLLRASTDGPPLIDTYSSDGTLRKSAGVLVPFQESLAAPAWSALVDDVTSSAEDPTWDWDTFTTGRCAVPFVVRRDLHLIAVGNRLICYRHDQEITSIELPHFIVAMTLAHAENDFRLAVAFTKGGMLLDVRTLKVTSSFLAGISRPSIGFTRDGRFVAIGDGAATVGSIPEAGSDGDGTRLREWPGFFLRAPANDVNRLPILLPAVSPRSFALVSTDGFVRIYHA